MAGDTLPLHSPPHYSFSSRLARSHTAKRLVGLVAIILLAIIILPPLHLVRRDLGYIFRPLWDSPEPRFHIIPHYPRPAADSATDHWCGLHGWTASASRPTVIDAIQISTELDLLEIRMREYAPYVSLFVIVESDKTHSGAPKPLHFAQQRERFEDIARVHNARIAYRTVTDFEVVATGSASNEVKQRVAIGHVLKEERMAGHIPPGSLVIMSDADEIISRDTLDLLTSCRGYPDTMHLSVRNYRYSFDLPLRDEGYWRPKVVTVSGPADGGGVVGYNHARGSDVLLADSGWHCSFCFPTLDDIRAKMTGYIHNDRMSHPSLLREHDLRRRVCRGQDPFGMWPVST